MQIDKSKVVEALRARGQDDKAAQADAQLPDPVDPDAHADILGTLGVDPTTLVGDADGGADSSSPRDPGDADEALDADGTLGGEPSSWGGSTEGDDGKGGLAGGLGGGVR